MPPRADLSPTSSSISLAHSIVEALRAVRTGDELKALIEAIASEMNFRHYALIDHCDLRGSPPGLVSLMHYPAAAVDRLIGGGLLRRDPIIRGCAFAGGAFLWSELQDLIEFGRQDRIYLQLGMAEGLNEGITVPYVRLGDPIGSCTFAGTSRPELVPKLLGIVQMVGIFAFHAARRLSHPVPPNPAKPPRLHPRPRDCVVLVGQGYSNKEIARALSLTPRTVDGYLTEARRQFAAHDRTELVASAVLAGEVDLHELRRQPE